MITRYCYIHFQQMHCNDIVLFLLQFTILHITRYRVIIISSNKTTHKYQKAHWQLNRLYTFIHIRYNDCSK